MAVVGRCVHDVLGVRVLETGTFRQALEQRLVHDVVHQRVADESARTVIEAAEAEEPVIVLHHGHQIRFGLRGRHAYRGGSPRLFDPRHLGRHSLDDAGIMKRVEVLHACHLLRRLQVLEDPAGGDHIVHINARSHDHAMLSAGRPLCVR